MKKKQKWELLKYAYDNYPKDSVARFGNTVGVNHVSDGTFKIQHDEWNGVVVLNGGGTECFYSENEDGKYNPEWATIITPSILTGKCAISVDNEREFKLLMDHYEGKGWRSLSDDTPSRVGYVPFTWSYEDSFGHAQEEFRKSEGSRVIPFADFAAEVGVTVPVFVMQSEDGVPLYEGDNYYRAGRSGANGKGDFVLFETNGLRKCHFVCSYPEIDKAFSTKEAAEAWILEANKPKPIEVKLFGGKTANIHHDLIRVFNGNITINFAPSDIEDLLHYYNKLIDGK